ncbi:MAG TPA: PadR family transcriptional regulator [Nocardioidaceae bacterium]|nr:PadR family transcriptional regulator [Nocardioidaceae bacterium]
MALEHVILVSLSERAASGADLTRRFDKSLGFFWSATHQQIYRVLARMEKDGWVVSEVVPQADRPATKVYDVTDAGHEELRRWIAEPTAIDPLRSDLMVKFRAASYGDPGVMLETAREKLDEHTKRLAVYEFMTDRDYPDPSALEGRDLDTYLVLQAGVLMEKFWIDWLTLYLERHGA